MNRGRRGGGGGGGGGGGRGHNTYYSPRGRSSPDSSSSQPHTPGGTDGFYNKVPADGNVVPSQFGRRTSGRTLRGNSKHFGHTPFSDHSYQPKHPSATRNHPNSPQGLDRSSCLPDTFSSPNSGFNDFSSLSVQSDSGDKHPSVVNTEFTPSKSTMLSQSGIKNESSDKEKQFGQISHEKAGTGRPANSGCENHPSLSAQSDPGLNHPSVMKDQRGKPVDTLVGFKNISLRNTDFTPSKSSTLRITKEPSEKEKLLSQNFHEKAGSIGRPENSDCVSLEKLPFDICPEKPGNLVRLNAPLLMKNREKRNEAKRSMEGRDIHILRPGMILLKSYISSADQANIVKICRKLGLGSGGFYQPRYRDGAEIHLKMMCLGMNWDPDTGKYGNPRRVDGAEPPVIPNEFQLLVKAVIEESHAHLQTQRSPLKDVEATLPWMSPNICIINFYSKSGRLGLHQDKDESVESLNRGLPVVSFSVGDSAEFLYGDDRDPLKAEKVVLESGDVLLFGGKSRRVFHGVTNIVADTAPKTLLEATNFRSPGRLNLTFRQF